MNRVFAVMCFAVVLTAVRGQFGNNCPNAFTTTATQGTFQSYSIGNGQCVSMIYTSTAGFSTYGFVNVQTSALYGCGTTLNIAFGDGNGNILPGTSSYTLTAGTSNLPGGISGFPQSLLIGNPNTLCDITLSTVLFLNSFPSLGSLSPSSGPTTGNNQVTLTGTWISAGPNDVTAVALASVSAGVVSQSSSQIIVNAGATSYATSGTVSVTSTAYGVLTYSGVAATYTYQSVPGTCTAGSCSACNALSGCSWCNDNGGTCQISGATCSTGPSCGASPPTPPSGCPSCPSGCTLSSDGLTLTCTGSGLIPDVPSWANINGLTINVPPCQTPPTAQVSIQIGSSNYGPLALQLDQDLPVVSFPVFGNVGLYSSGTWSGGFLSMTFGIEITVLGSTQEYAMFSGLSFGSPNACSFGGPGGSFPIAIVAGAAAGGAALIVIIVLIVVCVRRRQNARATLAKSDLELSFVALENRQDYAPPVHR